MNVKTDFPRRIREIEHTWIPLSDGTRLGARIWLPEDAEQDPVPAILEYLPYRKSDATAVRDSVHHPYFAGHGYASLRVDIRGTGDSDGVLLDEYLPQEQQDACEVLTWIAEQPWSTGKVGMYGKSWGGFNGLQVAAHQPPELGAVISLCSTDDRYADDVHYMGGCVLASKMLYWSSYMLTQCALPPDPKNVGEDWREMWLDRLENLIPSVEIWLKHQLRDGYWKQGSVCEDFSAITCPVYVVGGWADGYTNAIPRLLEGLQCPRKGLIGPWAHQFPERGVPGPAIGFLQECLRWWDHWLKGINTRVMDEPELRVWMQESKKPEVNHEEWPGFWIEEEAWPSVSMKDYVFGDRGKLGDSSLSQDIAFAGTLAHGQDCGNWCPMGVAGDYPPDQRGEDGRALTFTSEPLEDRLDVLGFPEVQVKINVDKPQAILAVRLCEVFPDDTSALLSWGVLNLTHDVLDETHTPLDPEEPYDVTVKLNAIGCRISQGNRLRVALSPTYWPQIWPSPEGVAITLREGRLQLPEHTSKSVANPFAKPEGAPALEHTMLRPSSRLPVVESHSAKGAVVHEVQSDGGRVQLRDGLVLDQDALDRWEIDVADPLSAKASCEREIVLERDGWKIWVRTESEMRCDHDTFYLKNKVVAKECGDAVFCQKWEKKVSREGC